MAPKFRVVSGLLLAIVVAAMAPSPASAAPAEVRGTWLTTTGTDTIASGANTAATMAALRGLGLNTVYVETWKNGYTQFPSQTLQSLIGVDRRPGLGSRDMLDETLIHAHRNGMVNIGWFEYGLASQFHGGTPVASSTYNPITKYMNDRGWILRDQSGNVTNASNGFAWMNPAVPQVRKFIVDMAVDAAKKYDLDGIQMDDRLAWPREFGFDSTTLALYQSETGRTPSGPTDTRFGDWRRGKVTLLANEIVQGIRAARPDLRLSVSPAITTFSETSLNADWPAWARAGLFDEYVPQAYRSNIGDFNSIITAQTAVMSGAGELEKYVVGLRGNGTGADTPWNDLRQMILRSRQEGAIGHSVFYSKAMLESYTDEFRSFYNVAGTGHAQHPAFAADWRSAPVVAVALSSSNWRVNVPKDGWYRVVAEFAGIWREVSSSRFTPGLHTLSLSGASAVELLVDRRPQPVPEPAAAALAAIALVTCLSRRTRHTLPRSAA